VFVSRGGWGIGPVGGWVMPSGRGNYDGCGWQLLLLDSTYSFGTFSGAGQCGKTPY